MRSHAKAPSVGSTDGRALSSGRALLSALVAIAVLMGLSAAPASALKAHFFLEDFGSVAKPEFNDPGAVAIDRSNGDVLVADPEAATLSRFKSDGTPDDFSALGSNVIDGEGLGDGTPQGKLVFGPDFSGAVDQIAVDNSGGATDGDIYLAAGKFREDSRVVYVFASSGEYLGELTEYEEGANASGPLAVFPNKACGVAVAPDGAVYVGDYEGYIHKYVPSANPPVNSDNVANFEYPNPCSLAVGTGSTAGFLFANSNGRGLVSKIDAATGEAKYAIAERVNAVAVDPATGDLYTAMEEEGNARLGFHHYDASGASAATLLGEGRAEGTSTAGVAVSDSTGDVYLSQGFTEHLRVYTPLLTQADVGILSAQEVSATRARIRGTVNPDGVAITECKFEYGTVESGTFSESAPCEESIPTDTETHTVSAVATGLDPGVEYQYRLVATNTDGRTSTSGEKTFRLLSRVFTAGPTGVRTDSATLNGLVRPEGEGTTECEFEYGADASYGESAPCSPVAASIPADFATHQVSGQISGLEEFAVYHYRLSITTAAGAFAGKDEVFRTLGPSGLPDNRRYEQVSPVDKNHSDIDPVASASMASIDGNRLAFRSRGSFAGAPSAQLSGVHYLAARGPGGWSTESIGLPGGELGSYGYQAFTADLSKGVIKWPEDTQIGPYDPSAQRGINLYLRDMSSGSFDLLNGTLAPAETTGVGRVVWGSSDFSHLAITSHSALTPEAAGLECDSVVEANHYAPCAYEWDEGTLRLASIVNGVPVEGTPGDVDLGRSCGEQHAMSDDGSRLFFTSPPELFEPGQLYAREGGTTTTPISESERTLPGGVSGERVDYQDAEAAHGNRVLFTTKNSLLDEDTNETTDLYLYDYAKPADERLTLLSKDEDPAAPEGASIDHGPLGIGECGGVMGASEDLKRVYFVADNQILAGEPEAAGPKLFLWDDTGSSPIVTYISKLSAGDSKAWTGALSQGVGADKQARLSSDGRYLALLSTAKLTSFENEGQEEVYRYDAVTQTMECASCSPDAVPAIGEVSFESGGGLGQPIYNHPPTNVTDKGQVLFETTRGLIPADSNGQMDVYEYEGGRLSLISSGEGPEGSFFLDATPSGSDVFFTTKDRLVGWDKDSNTDAYDARGNGGFPEPPLLPPDCAGDACQPAPNPPNDATPASSSFEGSGNVSEQPKASRCSKGKVRRHGRCVKRRKHTKKHARHQRTATRSHG